MLLLSVSFAYGFQATFTPRIAVGEEYTDNYFLTDQNKEHEYITTISPGFTAQILGETKGVEISYDPSYAVYDKYTENDTWRHSAQFSGWAELSKNTRLDIRDSFSLTEDPQAEADIATIRTEDPTTPIDSTIRRSRQTYITNTTSANIAHQFGESDSINLGYAYSFLDNDDPSIEDNERHNPSIGLTYWFVPQWGFEVRGSYAKGEFDVSDDLDEWQGSVRLIKRFTRHFDGFVQYRQTVRNYEGESEDDKTYNPSIGISYAIEEDISLSIDVGYFVNDYEQREDESGGTGNLSLIKRFSRGSVNLSGLGGYEYANFGAENLGFSQFYEAACSATYQVTRRISGNVFGSYRNDDYSDPEREDKTARAGLGLTIQPLEWMSIGLNYTFRSLDSTDNTNDYDENRLYFRITLSPTTPFRLTQ